MLAVCQDGLRKGIGEKWTPPPHTSLTERRASQPPHPHPSDIAMSISERLEIVEQDEAGNITSTYIASSDSRVDVVVRAFLSPTPKSSVGQPGR
jgi:hypothetical protein